MPVVGRAPQQHRYLHRSEVRAVEDEAERWRGGRDGAYTSIGLPGLRRWLGRLRYRMDARRRQRGTKIVPGVCRAIWVDPVEVRYSARFDEHGEAAIRESEGPDALRIDFAATSPVSQHEIDQPAQLGGPAPQHQHLALIIVSIAGVADRGDNEAGSRQCERRIIMRSVGSAAAVRDHDERQRMAATGPDGATRCLKPSRGTSCGSPVVGYQTPAISGGSPPLGI
ncbi:hypothetical protein LB572_09675 [Mesorhizobium sp. BH1-1-5]|uniref:hypothetical protein n=1 Tax=Mesorhizobium sp. BH1-1-5 TaxID=2876661 RepID=UPI001CCD7BA4|nr:hypothetical protein [Mesorhizobium sp. BH1-1-5]MBZ9987366.1 hypothetical protein [Mesorhizobium sp. BH1-1-5]